MQGLQAQRDAHVVTANQTVTPACVALPSYTHTASLLLQLVEVEFVPTGRILVREGNLPDKLVVVRQGAVQVTGSTLPGVCV